MCMQRINIFFPIYSWSNLGRKNLVLLFTQVQMNFTPCPPAPSNTALAAHRASEQKKISPENDINPRGGVTCWTQLYIFLLRAQFASKQSKQFRHHLPSSEDSEGSPKNLCQLLNPGCVIFSLDLPLSKVAKISAHPLTNGSKHF